MNLVRVTFVCSFCFVCFVFFYLFIFLLSCCCFSFANIYILIALALDESIILDVPQFPMQNIYQSCDLGRAIGRRNVNASQ